MGFVDEAVVKAKEVFDVAAKKTGDVVETQKLKFKATQSILKFKSNLTNTKTLVFVLIVAQKMQKTLSFATNADNNYKKPIKWLEIQEPFCFVKENNYENRTCYSGRYGVCTACKISAKILSARIYALRG